MRTQENYGAVGGSQQAAAVTYFGFLSFFPVLALAVFAVGLVARVWPDAQAGLADAINQVVPGLVGSGEGQVSLSDVQRFSGWAGLVGLLGVLYAGLGWISALRTALQVVFDVPAAERPGWLRGKLNDLVALIGVGAVLFVSVVGAGLVTGWTDDVLGWLGLGQGASWAVSLIALVIAWVVDVVLFFALFRLVGRPAVPGRSLWQAAMLGGVGFEILKALSFLVLGSVRGSPAFQAFGVAVVLLVWMNYFMQVVLYGASWAQTSPAARKAEAGA
ncbi:YihY/virulence factor BrkB family protein [Nocardioides sp.]|uniref:YihY/virulence factor BrkB family protein n=1 Tax=Nocardioides sp. TaxID=35761 RepID=UPI0039E4CC54